MKKCKAGLLLVLASSLLAGCGSTGPSGESSNPGSSEGASLEESQLPSSLESSEQESSSSEVPSSASLRESSEEIESSEEPESSSQEEPSSSEETSSREESSLEESSEEAIAHAITVSGSGYSVEFLTSKTAYCLGDKVEFTLRAVGSNYSLKGVYYTEKGTNYPRTSVSEIDGVYSFLMPNFDITLTLDSERLYSISFEGSHYSYTLSQEGPYFAANTKLSLTLEIEEGYMLTGKPTGTYLQVSSESSGTSSFGITEESPLHYSFFVPSGNATISVPVEKKPDVSEDDPFTVEATYVGKFYYTDSYYTDYTSTLTVTFTGDGMLDWSLYYSYVSSDYGGDYGDYAAFPSIGGAVKLESSGPTEVFSYSRKKYSIDKESSTLSFLSPGRLQSQGDKSWSLKISSAKDSSGLPSSLTFVETISSDVPQCMKSAGTVLTRNK